MRNIVTILFTFLCLCSNAQNWQPVGPDYADEVGFSFNNSIINLTSDGDSLYIAMTARTSFTYTAVIKQFKGQGWDTLGASFTTSANSGSVQPVYPYITMDKAHTPYVFYNDLSAAAPPGAKGSVKKYINGSWVQVGTAGFTNVGVQGIQMKMGKADTPYVLYSDLANKLTVRKFNGTS